MPDADQNKSEGEIKETGTDAPVEPSQTSTVEPSQTPSVAEPPKAASRTVLYALAVIAFGILAGIGTAAYLFHHSEATLEPPPPPPSIVSHDLQDLGAAEAAGFGLKGHLTTQWTSQPGYHVTIEPYDATMAPGFALAISNPPHPLSVKIELQDRLGYVMCSQDVLVKLQPQKPADLEQTELPSGSKPRKVSAKQQEHLDAELADFDHAQALELAREKGKEVFQSQAGSDGKVVSISAQGAIPCPAETYTRVAKWGFVPDFPTVEEQDELVSNQPETKEVALRNAAQRARRKLASKSPAKTLSFSLEGDDAVVDFDIAGGVLETRAGKTFMIEKSGATAGSAVWQEYPAYFHYRCEQTTSSCTLARAGGGVMHATLKR